MNRATKWYQTTKENKRPRRQCYQPLSIDEDLNYATSDINHSIDGTLKLASISSDHFVEKVLEPGDTLLSLSLKFNCPVAELKRINNILRDNEIFARRKIKVPVKPGSITIEKLAGVHISNGLKSENYNDCTNAASSTDDENENLLVSKSSSVISELYSPKFIKLKEFNKRGGILNCEPGPSTATTPVSEENTLLDLNKASVPSLSTEISDEGAALNSEDSMFKCNGADWGLSWLQLVICVLLLSLAGPLFIYILYITEWKHKN